jgi:hypothetical protein
MPSTALAILSSPSHNWTPLHQQQLVSISFLAAQPEAMPSTAFATTSIPAAQLDACNASTAFATTPIPAAQLEAMHQQHLQLHQLQQHNWMQCINSICNYINSSSTTGCNASTAFATTPTPAAQLDNAIKSIDIYIISGITTRAILIPAAQLDAMYQKH